MPLSRRQLRSGYSLLEAMIALAIAALSILIVYSGLFSRQAQESKVANRLLASQLARSLANELAVIPDLPQTGSINDLRWQIETTALAEGEDLQNFTILIFQGGQQEAMFTQSGVFRTPDINRSQEAPG